eukprot:5392954-Pyramimonas_sp.AAC.1
MFKSPRKDVTSRQDDCDNWGVPQGARSYDYVTHTHTHTWSSAQPALSAKDTVRRASFSVVENAAASLPSSPSLQRIPAAQRIPAVSASSTHSAHGRIVTPLVTALI